MLHYKAFSSDQSHGDIAALERTVNAWLEEVHPLVHTMTQSPCGGGTVVSFLYELDEEQREQVAAAVAEAEEITTSPTNLMGPVGDTLTISLLPLVELPY